MLAGPSRGVIATFPLARVAGHGLAHRAALCSSAGKAAEAPAPASAPSSEKGPRLHSTDVYLTGLEPQPSRLKIDLPLTRAPHFGQIAFKPTTDGWGYSHVYGSGWDNIFKKKGNAKEPPPPSPPVPDPQQQQQQLSVKLEALDKALGVGALSPALYEQARRELE